MPNAIPRACAVPRCPHHAVSGGSRCPDHAQAARTEQLRWQTGKRRTTSEKGYNGSWRRLRTMALNRDRGICRLCRRVEPRMHVDHIVPKAQGGRNTLENLQTLCGSCHGKKTAQERTEKAQKERTARTHGS